MAATFLRNIDKCFQRDARVAHHAPSWDQRKQQFKDAHLSMLGYPASDSLVAQGYGKSSRWRKKKKAHKQRRAAVKPMVPAPQELRFVIKPPLGIGRVEYRTVVINGLAFCRVWDLPELYECPVGQEYALPARLLTPHRPHSRPDWFGIAQRHKGLQYPDLSHWSQQLDWVNNNDNHKLTNVM